MKIVLFLCKSKHERFHLNKAGFVVIGSYLCWSYPSEAVVHILDMTAMKTKKVDKFELFGVNLTNVMKNALGSTVFPNIAS